MKILHLEDRAEEVPGGRALQQAAPHDVGRILPDRGIGIELGIELVGDLVEVQQGLAQHGELGRQSKIDISRDAPDLEHDPSDLDIPDLRVLVASDEIRHPPREDQLVERWSLLGQLQDAGHGLIAPTFADRQKKLE